MTKKNEIKNNGKLYLKMHILFFVYSIGSIFSKFASKQPFLSPYFILYYSIVIINLFIYALIWQQILKEMPLRIAFANKAITLFWGMLWGMVIFGEKISCNNIIGAIIVFIGIIMVVKNG